MKKSLTIGLASAALIAGAASLVKVDSSKYGPLHGTSHTPANVVTQAAAAESELAPVIIRMAQLAVSQPYMLDYERGPRIIHVPQPGERTNDRGVRQPAARASLERRPEPAAIEEDDDAEYVPPPRPRVAPPKPRVAVTPPPPQPPAAITPRWKLRSESPPPPPPLPSGPRRAVLSAPPLSADGPTPLRPTPRFDAKADRREGLGQKFAAPSAPVAPAQVVTESQPPLGYLPPAMPAQPSDDVPSASPLPED